MMNYTFWYIDRENNYQDKSRDFNDETELKNLDAFFNTFMFDNRYDVYEIDAMIRNGRAGFYRSHVLDSDKDDIIGDLAREIQRDINNSFFIKNIGHNYGKR